MLIRPATAQDAPAICAIWNPVIRDTLATFNSVEKTPDDITAMLSEKATQGHAFLLAEAENTILGFATFGQFRGGIGYAHTFEHTIILGDQARGRGVGRALMTALEDAARTAGGHSLFAGVSAGNPAGVAFHRALGFQEVATLPEVGRKFERWLDLVLLQKLL